MKIEKIIQSNCPSPEFSILLPTWNNLACLQLAVDSIRKHAHFTNQIIVIINEGNDGTLAWVKQQPDLDYVYCAENIGICFGLNAARTLVRAKYICYLNDDMYVCPKFDYHFKNAIDRIGHDDFFLSGTMIEPQETGNDCVIVADFGDSPDTFSESELLAQFESFSKSDWCGATWPPNVLSVDLWDLVGGMSIEYSPGMYSDPDLSRKLWAAGVRVFKGIGASRVYHFGSKSTKKVKQNKGRRMFLMKWGTTAKAFTTQQLNRGQPFSEMPSAKEISPTFLDKCKQVWMIFR